MKVSSGNRHIAIFIIILLLCASTLFAETDGALILEQANSNENIYSAATGEFVSYLRGDVVFRYEDIRISSDEATWRRNDGIIDFSGNVKVEQKGQVMTSNRLHFVRDENVLTATGNVLYRDSAGITFIRGETAEYMTDKREALLRGNPLLTRIDSTETDTLFISGRIMLYNDSLKTATVTDSVNIRRGDLFATCENGKYFSDINTVLLRINPVIYYESHKVVGDSIDLTFNDEALESAIIMGNAHGHYTEIADESADTTTTHIWSDTLRLHMYENGKINSMKAFGCARGSYSEITALSGNTRVTNISSDSLFMFMFETGKISGMKAFGSARGNYSETAASSGNTMSTNISSDSMHMFMFETGKINSIKAFGSAHGRNAEFRASSPSNDSTITHIWSDSLHVLMSDAGRISVMRAFENVLSKNFSSDDSTRVNEVSGKIMTLAFGEDGKIEEAVVRGNAKSIYFIDESDGGGCNKANGDEIIVTFTDGKAQRLRIRGKVRGIYFP